MIIILSIIFLFIIVIYCIKNRIFIDFKSFFQKGFIARRGQFGVYCFCGKQGTGKTFACVQFIKNNVKNYPIYSNITLTGIDYTHFDGFDEMLKIKDHHCIIVYDEIFTALSKQSRISPEIMSFLSQQRKKNVIFITTAQEWLEIPMTLRRYVRFQIDCFIFNNFLLPFSILIERYRDGENMKWDNNENDYIAPVIATKIQKMAKKITTHYDTNEEKAVFGGVRPDLSGHTTRKSAGFRFSKKLETPRNFAV